MISQRIRSASYLRKKRLSHEEASQVCASDHDESDSDTLAGNALLSEEGEHECDRADYFHAQPTSKGTCIPANRRFFSLCVEMNKSKY